MLGRSLYSRLRLFTKSSNVSSELPKVYSVAQPPTCALLPCALIPFSFSTSKISTAVGCCQASKSHSSSSKNMDTTDRVADPKSLSENDWKHRLDSETFNVCRLKGTELPGSGKYLNHSEKGTYVCICCQTPLFRSEDKFNHCGWPSFRQAMGTDKDGKEDATDVKREFDGSRGRQRTEVLCKKCDSHLGHVFDDGPEPFGRRFCINSVSLNFVED